MLLTNNANVSVTLVQTKARKEIFSLEALFSDMCTFKGRLRNSTYRRRVTLYIAYRVRVRLPKLGLGLVRSDRSKIERIWAGALQVTWPILAWSWCLALGLVNWLVTSKAQRVARGQVLLVVVGKSIGLGGLSWSWCLGRLASSLGRLLSDSVRPSRAPQRVSIKLI